MVRLAQFLANAVAISLQEGDEILVVGDALLQVSGVQHVAEFHPAVGFNEFPPRGGADTFWNQVRVAPLVFVNLALEQHLFDFYVFLAGSDLRVHPGIALQQPHLLVHLLVETGENPLAGGGQGLYHGCLALNLLGEAVAQGDIQPQGFSGLLPCLAVELLADLSFALHHFDDASGHVSFVFQRFCKSGLSRLFAGEGLIHQMLNSFPQFLG